MADKAISDLTQALQITNEDLFVLEQGGEAKKLRGSQVVQYAKDSVAAEVQGVKEYADSAKKCESTSENLRNQIQGCIG
jgi:hypothetical protein